VAVKPHPRLAIQTPFVPSNVAENELRAETLVEVVESVGTSFAWRPAGGDSRRLLSGFDLDQFQQIAEGIFIRASPVGPRP